MIHPRAKKANYGSRDKCGSNRDQMASRAESMDYLTLYRKTHASPNPGSKERKGEPPAGDRVALHRQIPDARAGIEVPDSPCRNGERHL